MARISQFIIRGFALVLTLSAVAQSSKSRFQHLTIEDGLPQNMVDCMLQDSYGFVWIGTWNGLSRYDGYDFEVFDDPGNGLDNSFIYALEEDHNRNIWIGTRVGLTVRLANESRFEKIAIPDFQSALEVRDLKRFQDSLMIVGSDRGVSILQLTKDTKVELIRHLALGKDLQGSIVSSILVDSWQNVWMGTDAGLYFLSAAGDLKHYEANDGTGLLSNQILAICEVQNKDIWVGTEFGAYHFIPSENLFVSFLNESGNPSSLIHNSVMDVLELDNGHLLFATLGGLSEYDPGANQFVNFLHDPNADHSLSNDFVNCLMKDESGNLWIGTERGGVNYYNTSQNQIEHFEQFPDNPNSLSSSTINSIYEDSKFLWIGTAGGGLNRLDKRKKSYKHYRHVANDPEKLSSDFVTSILRNSRGELWVGTWGSGINILNESNQTFTQHLGREGMASSFVSSIVEDKRGAIWLGTLGGISKYDPKTDQYTVLFSDQTPTRITNVGCMLFDHENSLWVGSRYGLYHLESQDGFRSTIDVTHYQHNDRVPQSLSGNYVISLFQSKDGAIWVGTYGQGINKLVREKDSARFEAYGMSNGLSNTVIYGIEQDDSGNLWLSTDYGLARLNPATGLIRNYFKADGFLNNQYYWSASFKNKEGKLYFGGMNGLDAFHPEWIQQDAKASHVIITDLKLLNESIKPGEVSNGVAVLEDNIHETQAINLSYKEKVLGIEFSALNYQEPNMIRYAYILGNFESEWNYVSSTRRFATYTNLKPGDYVFKVKSSGSNGEFNGPVREIQIHIAPPFWNTIWFRGGSIIAVILLFFGYVRYRTYSLNRQKRLLEQQVRERTERINQQNEALSFQAVQLQRNNDDLETKQKLIEGQNQKLESQNKEIVSQRDEVIKLNDKLKLVSQLKLSFFTNISHEFRTPLTLIIGPIEKLLKEKGLTQEAKSTLQVMNRSAQRLLHLINQIMDFRKIEKGRMELRVSKGNIGEFCKNVFSAFEPLAQTKSIQFTYFQNEVPYDVWFDQQKMENVLYNLLSNAFKYTSSSGKIQLELRALSLEESKLSVSEELIGENKPIISIRVVDSGMGISSENLPLVFKRFYRIESEEAFKISGSGIGLALTEELIKTHHGDIFVESILGQGSTFEVQFPCLEDAYHSSELSESRGDSIDIHEQVALLNNEFIVGDELEEGFVMEESDSSVDAAQKPLLLVVEDNKDLRKFMAHRLREQYRVMEAEDGAVGIQLAESNNPDLVISDVMMPNVDGLELCGSLKNNLSTSHIPIILLTAKSAVENKIEGLQIGADDYLAKPFNFDLLVARINNLIDTRQKLRAQFINSDQVMPHEMTTNTKDQKFIERAFEVVETNLADSSFGVKQFVDQMGISRSLLHKKLTGLTEQSAAEFINHLRMKKAKGLLQQNDLNVSEVAYSVGYNDPKYFSRLFSKSFGESPKDYANKFVVER